MHRSLVRNGVAAIVALAFFQLSGCGGGGGSSSNSGSSSSSTPTVPTTVLTGTVTAGSLMPDAHVTVIDSTGVWVNGSANGQSVYSISVKGMTPPFLIVASDAARLSAPLVSVLAQLPDGPAPAVANVTTLTTAVAAMLTVSGNPLDLASPTALAKVAQATVQIEADTLSGILGTILARNGVGGIDFDLMGGAFTPDHTGVDAVIDAVSVVPAANGGLMLLSNAAPNTTVALNRSTTRGVILDPPPAPANYLEPLATLLTACAASGTFNASCSPAIDATFLENGSTDLAVGHGFTDADLTGAVFGSPKTLAFVALNGKQQTLVQFPVTLSDGKSAGLFYSIVQQRATPVTLTDGTQFGWDLIGNQSQFAVSINSQIARRAFLDLKPNDVDRYESGLMITIPTASNPSVYSASVTGPGLAAPVWLMQRTVPGGSTLALSDAALSAAPVSPATTGSNTTFYRWSWQSISSTANFLAPAASGYYAVHPVDASIVPLYSTYTITFYDRNGAQLGQSPIINPGSALSAAAGNSIVWPTLLPDFANQFLTPGGSLAGLQSTASVTWSGLMNGQDLAFPVTSVQIQATGLTASGPAPEVDGYFVGAPNGSAVVGQYQATVSAGSNSLGVLTCLNCGFPPLTSGYSRLVQLNGGQDTTAFYDSTAYND